MTAAVGEVMIGGVTDWERARCADVGESGLQVGDGYGFGTVPVGEPVFYRKPLSGVLA